MLTALLESTSRCKIMSLSFILFFSFLSTTDSGSKLTTGTIAAIVIGILVALAVTLALMYFLFSNKL